MQRRARWHSSVQAQALSGGDKSVVWRVLHRMGLAGRKSAPARTRATDCRARCHPGWRADSCYSLGSRRTAAMRTETWHSRSSMAGLQSVGVAVCITIRSSPIAVATEDATASTSSRALTSFAVTTSLFVDVVTHDSRRPAPLDGRARNVETFALFARPRHVASQYFLVWRRALRGRSHPGAWHTRFWSSAVDWLSSATRLD